MIHAPPVATTFRIWPSKIGAFRLGDPNNKDGHPTTSGENEGVQNLSHMPPEPRKSDTANPWAFRLSGQDNDDGNTLLFPGAKIQKPGALQALNEIEVLNHDCALSASSHTAVKRTSSFTKISLLISYTSAQWIGLLVQLVLMCS